MQQTLTPNARIAICKEFKIEIDGKEYTGWKVLSSKLEPILWKYARIASVTNYPYLRADSCNGERLSPEECMTKEKFENKVKEEWEAGEIQWQN